MKDYLNTAEAAEYCGLSIKTLAMHRTNGTGCPYSKIGRILYARKDLDEWILSKKRTSTARAQDADVCL